MSLCWAGSPTGRSCLSSLTSRRPCGSSFASALGPTVTALESMHHRRLCRPVRASFRIGALLTRHYRRVGTPLDHFGAASATVGAIFQYSVARSLASHHHRSGRHQRAHNQAQTLGSDLDAAAERFLSADLLVRNLPHHRCTGPRAATHRSSLDRDRDLHDARSPLLPAL